MTTLLPLLFACLCLTFLIIRWRLSVDPTGRVNRETAAFQAYLAWKPAEIESK